MSTTNLFVELLIVGIGAFFWILLIVIGVMNVSIESITLLFEMKYFIPLISIIYVLGIVIDRVADSVFDKLWGNKIRDSIFPDRNNYYRARSLIFSSSESISDLLEYNRSRLRICRGWTLNSVMMISSLNLYAFRKVSPSDEIVLLSSVVLLLFSVGAWYAWRNILKKEYGKTKHQADLIMKNET